jgi:hypothetical protein
MPRRLIQIKKFTFILMVSSILNAHAQCKQQTLENIVAQAKENFSEIESMVNNEWKQIKTDFKDDSEKYLDAIADNEKKLLIGKQIIDEIEKEVQEGNYKSNQNFDLFRQNLIEIKDYNEKTLNLIERIKKRVILYTEKIKEFSDTIANVAQKGTFKGKQILELTDKMLMLKTQEKI